MTAPTIAEPSTAELLLEWDRRRARSRQTELGMSELGGCKRRAGYRLAGTEATDTGSSVQAVMGTAVHHAVETVYHEMQAAGLLPATDLIEHEVRFAGVLGHLDRYSATSATLRDTKTTSDRWLQHIVDNGPDRDHVWQTNLYAAALMVAGYPVRRIVVDYLARDTGRDHQCVLIPDTRHVRDALAWLDEVRGAEVDMLPREYAPDSPWCRHCPFRSMCWDGGTPDRHPRSVLFVENPDAAEWARQLDDARADGKAAKEREQVAKDALDALRPNTSGTSDPVDVGYAKCLQWQVSTSHRIDSTAVRAEYKRAGAEPPTKPSTSTKLSLIAADREDTER